RDSRLPEPRHATELGDHRLDVLNVLHEAGTARVLVLEQDALDIPHVRDQPRPAVAIQVVPDAIEVFGVHRRVYTHGRPRAMRTLTVGGPGCVVSCRSLIVLLP